MKMSESFQLLIIVTLLVSLSGCSRIIDWTKERFYQGKDVEVEPNIAKQYLKSVAAYNQLETAAIFDALWLSDNVRTAYVDLHVLKFCKTDEQRNNMLRRQLEENNHFITFYVLSLFEVPLEGTNVNWAVFLRINGKTYAPTEIKAVELSPEWRKLFGRRYSRFKQPYIVKFDAKDIEEQLLITKETLEIALHFRSFDKELVLAWEVNNHGSVVQKNKNKKTHGQTEASVKMQELR